MSAHKVAINPKTLIAEKGLFLGLGYILCYFSYEDMLLEMFAAVRMFAVGLQSTEGELVQHACEQQNQVVLVLSYRWCEVQQQEARSASVWPPAVPVLFSSAGATLPERVGTTLPVGWYGRLENAQSASNFSPGYAPSIC